jgi:cob(I)alamin adenosyltransferase
MQKRRAERRACALKESGELRNTEIVIYLDRLNDLLWLFARLVETKVDSTHG